MTINIRRQLTLFIEPQELVDIEKVRQQFNPRQSKLIRGHLTLCREDEIENLEQIITNLHGLNKTEIAVEFGEAIRFANGKGVLLPAKPGNIEFQELRRQILAGINDNPRIAEPHITLMHPRNSICTDNIFAQIKKISLPTKLTFKTINLIEQRNGGRWNILQEFKFKACT